MVGMKQHGKRKWKRALFAVCLLMGLALIFSMAAAESLELSIRGTGTPRLITEYYYTGGTNNYIGWWEIENYDELKSAWGGEPVWSITAEDGGETPMNWSNSGLSGKNIWLGDSSGFSYHAEKGDYTAILSCSWNGQTASEKITVHVIDPPNGPLTGASGIEDEYVLTLNEEITINIGLLPAGWSLPGEKMLIEHWCTRDITDEDWENMSYSRYGTPYFEITYGDTPGEMKLRTLLKTVT